MTDRTGNGNELNQFWHPAQAFGHPSNVLRDPDLTLNEKRAILASRASDACEREPMPDRLSVTRAAPVRFDEIMEALRTLDRKANGHRYRRIFKHRWGILRRDHPNRSNVNGALSQ
jgi:hypothetical protein